MTQLIKVKNKAEEIELLSMVDQNQSFPNHFHQNFCISLITKGIECMEINKKRIYSEKNHISINNPYEIHSNPLISNHQSLSFHTIYIPQQLLDKYANEKNIFFQKRSFKDLILNKYFNSLVEWAKDTQNELNPILLEKFIQRLIIHSTSTTNDLDFKFNFNWEEALSFINNNLKNTLNLETLANHCEMEKYKFAKTFKYFCGMSPMNYVLMERIFSAKGAISNNTNLTNIAYEYDFTDLAHFSKQFKRFVGLSPRNYQKNLKM